MRFARNTIFIALLLKNIFLRHYAWDEAATAVVFKPDKLPALYIIYYGYRHLGHISVSIAQPPHV